MAVRSLSSPRTRHRNVAWGWRVTLPPAFTAAVITSVTSPSDRTLCASTTPEKPPLLHRPVRCRSPGRLLPAPQRQHHATRLEENRLFDFLAVPAQLLVEPPRNDSRQRHQGCEAESLLHWANLTCPPRTAAPVSSSAAGAVRSRGARDREPSGSGAHADVPFGRDVSSIVDVVLARHYGVIPWRRFRRGDRPRPSSALAGVGRSQPACTTRLGTASFPCINTSHAA